MKEPIMVLDRSRRLIRDLAPLAEQLNAATDAFTKELVTIEAELASTRLGLEVTLGTALVQGDWEIEDEDEDADEPGARYRVSEHLGYGRYGAGWKLLVLRYRQYEDENQEDILESTTPLVQASRELRIAAAERIGDLLEVLASTAKSKLAVLDKVIDKPAQ